MTQQELALKDAFIWHAMYRCKLDKWCRKNFPQTGVSPDYCRQIRDEKLALAGFAGLLDYTDEEKGVR